MSEGLPRCPVCGADGKEAFFQALNVPVFCNVLWPDRAAAVAARRARISLAICGDCGLICNAAFDPHLMDYDPAYENSLHFSPRFQQYAADLAKRLVERHDLRGKDVVEIGCGQGDFLALLAEHGAGRCVGFDPSFDPATAHAAPGVTIVPEYFGARRAGGGGEERGRGGEGEKGREGERERGRGGEEDGRRGGAEAGLSPGLVCCRHVLEHIPDPVSFLQQVQQAAQASSSDHPVVPSSRRPVLPSSRRPVLPSSRPPVFFFEVPNALSTLKDMAVWDIIYEHCSYFTAGSLAGLFRRAGFQALAVTEEYEGQFLTIEARVAGGAIGADTSGAQDTVLGTAALCRDFRAAYEQKVSTWRSALKRLQGQGKRIVLWGAGSKGVTFLNVLSVPLRSVEFVVDINPRKAGRFIPGTGQQVVGPEFVREYRPDVVIVMNRIYVDEVRRQIGELGVIADVMTA